MLVCGVRENVGFIHLKHSMEQVAPVMCMCVCVCVCVKSATYTDRDRQTDRQTARMLTTVTRDL